MRTLSSGHRIHRYLVLCCALALLGGCSAENLVRTFGLTRDTPDEFTVTTRAPLSMPPDYNLRAPRPGISRPQEESERKQAEETLAPQTALNGTVGTASPGQAALVEAAGPSAPKNIRREVDQDARAAADADASFVDKVLFWRRPPPADVQVDAKAEAQRLRKDAALGQTPNTGTTPIIQPAKPGWFSSLFSWL